MVYTVFGGNFQTGFILEGIQLVIFTSFSMHKERNRLIWDQTHGFPFQAHFRIIRTTNNQTKIKPIRKFPA